MTHVCVSKSTIIGSDNGLPPGRCQAIVWTNAGMLLIGHLETNLSEILIEIHTFLLTKMHVKTSSAKWRPICLVHLHYQHRNYFNIKCIGLCCMRSYDCDDNKQSIDNGNADNVLLIMIILSLQGGHFFSGKYILQLTPEREVSDASWSMLYICRCCAVCNIVLIWSVF